MKPTLRVRALNLRTRLLTRPARALALRVLRANKRSCPTCNERSLYVLALDGWHSLHWDEQFCLRCIPGRLALEREVARHGGTLASGFRPFTRQHVLRSLEHQAEPWTFPTKEAPSVGR